MRINYIEFRGFVADMVVFKKSGTAEIYLTETKDKGEQILVKADVFSAGVKVGAYITACGRLRLGGNGAYIDSANCVYSRNVVPK